MCVFHPLCLAIYHNKPESFIYDSYAFRVKNSANDAKSLFITALSAKQIIQQVNHEITVCADAK